MAPLVDSLLIRQYGVDDKQTASLVFLSFFFLVFGPFFFVLVTETSFHGGNRIRFECGGPNHLRERKKNE